MVVGVGASASRVAAVRIVAMARAMARARVRRGAMEVDRTSSIATCLLSPTETVAKGTCQLAVTHLPSVLRKAAAESDPTWIDGPYMKRLCRT